MVDYLLVFCIDRHKRDFNFMVRKVGKYLLWLFLFAACQSQPPEETIDHETSAVTSKSEAILFQPTDLDSGWFPETYHQGVPDFESPTEMHPEEQFFVRMAAEPLPLLTSTRQSEPCCSIYSAYQFLYVYADEATAEAVFIEDANRFPFGRGSLPTNFESRLEHVSGGCNTASGTGIGHYLNCSFVAQHGRYFTHANMPVDGQLITLQDWEDLINAIQERLISQGGS